MKYYKKLFQNRRVIYLIAHGPHMLLGVTLVIIFSRLVPKEEFGIFARSFAFVNIIGAFLYGWLQISLLRFSNGSKEKRVPAWDTLVSAAALPIIPLILISFFMASIGAIKHPAATAFATVGYSLSVSFSQYARGANRALLYGLIGSVRMLVVLLVAFFSAARLPDSRALIIALAIGAFTSIVVGVAYIAKGDLSTRAKNVDYDSISLTELLSYGAPASLSLVSVMLLINADRFIAGYFLNPGDLGLYSAQVDLARQMVYPMISAIGVSLIPTMIRIDREQDRTSAEIYIYRESSFLLALATPLIILVIFYPNEIYSTLLPLEYSTPIDHAGPITAIAAGITGLRLLRFDPLFHLALEKKKIFLAAFSGLAVWTFLAWPLAHLQGANGIASLGLIAALVSCAVAYHLASGKILVSNILSFRTTIIIALCCGIVLIDKKIIPLSSSSTIFHLISLGSLMLLAVVFVLKMTYEKRDV